MFIMYIKLYIVTIYFAEIVKAMSPQLTTSKYSAEIEISNFLNFN